MEQRSPETDPNKMTLIALKAELSKRGIEALPTDKKPQLVEKLQAALNQTGATQVEASTPAATEETTAQPVTKPAAKPKTVAKGKSSAKAAPKATTKAAPKASAPPAATTEPVATETPAKEATTKPAAKAATKPKTAPKIVPKPAVKPAAPTPTIEKSIDPEPTHSQTDHSQTEDSDIPKDDPSTVPGNSGADEPEAEETEEISLDDLTPAERLKRRQERFSNQPGTDLKKLEAREKRFGTDTSSAIKETADKIAAREAKFGSVSAKLLEGDAKKRAREERFKDSLSAIPSTLPDRKKQKLAESRAARMGLPIKKNILPVDSKLAQREARFGKKSN